MFVHIRIADTLNQVKTSVQPFLIKTPADFEHLFNSHYSSLCSYANHFLKDIDASEEVVQEVMFKIWVNRKSLIINTTVRSYLFRAVRNGCMNVLKHIDIKEDFKAFKERESQEGQRSGEDEMIITELEQKIREVIDRLPLERRKVFIMSRYDGLTYIQIAEKLGISVKTVENQMGKALKTLRIELSDYLPWLILFFTDLIK
jgi:RNA polymerase sigma-70 factor, ECF subfamily